MDLTSFPELETERLLLRRINEADANEIFELRSDDDVNRYLDRQPASSVADALKHIENLERHMNTSRLPVWAITIKPDPKLVGCILLFEYNEQENSAEIGFELLPNHQRKGIMYEAVNRVIKFAFSDLHLQKISAYVHADNEASLALLKKLHFQKENRDVKEVTSNEQDMHTYILVVSKNIGAI